MNLLRTSLFTAFITLINYTLQAQSYQPVNVIHSSPESAAFERYKDYPVSLHTGVPDINIPIYEIKSGDVVIPISVSYHASGIKTTDVSYPVGLGWTLNAGGRVSRTVRGKVDESAAVRIPNYSLNNYTQLTYLDPEPDLFFYNSGVKNESGGRFIFTPTEDAQQNSQLINPVFFPQQNIKLAYDRPNLVMTIVNDKGQTFKYGGSNIEYNKFEGYYSAWMLSEILPTNKLLSDKITFNYLDAPDLTTCSTAGSMKIVDSIAYMSGNMNPGEPHFDQIYNIYQNNQLKRFEPAAGTLAYISNYDYVTQGNQPFYQQTCYTFTRKNLNNVQFKGGRVVFNYDAANTFLTDISIFDQQGNLIKKASFYYSNYAGETRKHLDRIEISGSDNQQPINYTFEYQDGIGVPNPIMSARDHWGYYNGATSNNSPVPRWMDVPVVALTKRDGNGQIDNLVSSTEIGAAVRETDEFWMKKYVLSKIKYPTGGYSEFTFEANRYYDEKRLTEVGGGIFPAGGLRIKTLKTSDGVNPPVTKTYTYGIDGNSQTGIGLPYNIPRMEDYMVEHYMYIDYSRTIQPDGSTKFELRSNPLLARERNFLSAPNNSISYTDGCPVWYTYVEEQDVNNAGLPLGKTVYRFNLPLTNQYQYYSANSGIFGNINQKYTLLDHGFASPRLKAKEIYKSDGANFSIVQAVNYSFVPIQSPLVQFYPIKEVVTYNQDIPQSAIEADDPFYIIKNPDAQRIVNIPYSELQGVDYTIGYERIINYNANGQNIIDSASKSTYYAYDGADPYSFRHTFPTKIGYEANGKSIIKEYKYAPDYQGITATDDVSKGIKVLQDNNVISTPVEETTKIYDKAGVNLIGTAGSLFRTFKTDQPLVDKVYAIEPEAPNASFLSSSVVNGGISFSNDYKIRGYFDRYTQEGNLLEQHPDQGVHSCYLWSYKSQYPIAKIENVTFSAIESLLGNTYIEDLKNNALPSTADLLALFTRLRGNLPYSQVTGYTYKPLVGMTSLTDAKGETTYYEYDSFQRLKTIKDSQGNILKQHDYHYQNQ